MSIMAGKTYRPTSRHDLIFYVIRHDKNQKAITWEYVDAYAIEKVWYYKDENELEEYQELSKLELHLRGLDK